MCEEVAKRARKHRAAGRKITLSIGYSHEELGGGFSRAKTIGTPTNVTMDLYRICLELFDKFYDGRTVRQIAVRLANIVPDEHVQLSLFEPNLWKQKQLGYIVDNIRRRYGSDALLRAVSYTEAGTARRRARLIGGHKA